MDRFPDVPCPRCRRLAQLFTVPLRLLPAGEAAWQALCGDCFRGVLQADPTSAQAMRPIRHAKRRQR